MKTKKEQNPAIDKVKFIGTFLNFKGLEGIDSFFNKKFQRWLYVNSHTKENITDKTGGRFMLKHDKDGNITNATFSGTTMDEIPFTRKDFTDSELKHLQSIDLRHLGLDEIKRLGFYKDYLINQSEKNLTNEIETPQPKYTAKHHVLAYLIECNAKGESFPVGEKNVLESIGNKRMGKGKGNRFYKVFNELVHKDLNVENNLIEIGGGGWREAVVKLSKAPESIESYLQNKQL